MSGGAIDWAGVAAAIAAAERTGGTVGVTVVAPGGQTFRHHGDRRFRAASTVKIPIMIALYREIDAGRCSLAERVTLRAEDKAGGSGVLLHLHDGLELTLGDLAYLMIAISDNTATNLLIDRVGLEAVAAVFASLGMRDSTLTRKMKGRAAQPGETENWATPDDYALAVRALLDGRAASPDSCAAMLAMLEKQQNRSRIARYLPEGEGIRWGSKTGSLPGVINDVGFITTPAGTLVVSVYTEGLPDLHAGEQAIGEIARAAMQATGILG
ncbi:MAG: class A beta-lactamase-related serine hydrolase [Sphaerobacter sp.]|nr:class A beta-lactamase-related serine hydrolase [Sphaerobacter sp.]